MGGRVMKQRDTITAIAAAGVGAALVLAYLATRQAGPVPMTQYTEQREGPLQEHLVTLEELGFVHSLPKMAYPVQVAPSVTDAINRGFAPLWRIPDPQAAALPAEQAW